ncbi:FecR family protein [Mangrovibacterium lignilyticum]|uniref:FecR family protein n=1 Tax=Mangrovibacterium lignilyticum TaxID=2668052 RepID=UPI0013D41ACC|nr:FecR domain-containing protein [Mangrovibacterium lignilyticum]
MDKNKPTNWELFAAKHQHELSDDELAALEQHQKENPDDWALSGKIKKGLDELSHLATPNQGASWLAIRQQIRNGQVRKITLNTFKYAAIIVVSLFVGYLLQMQTSENTSNQYAEIEVMDGQMGHLFLFDGTEVWLNSGSRLKYPKEFNQNVRDVYLEGEAYFEVAHNAELPFKVRMRKMEVEVLGTSFNVSAYTDDPNVAVVLEKGSVQLNQMNGTGIARLVPGEMAKLDQESNKLVVKKVDTHYYTNWKDGTLEFKGESLGEIAQKLERWYNVQIKIQDPSLVDYKITGTVLRNKPVQQIIQAFEFLAPIRTEYLSKSNQKDIINIYKK